jgi:putative transposon-encoded protein
MRKARTREIETTVSKFGNGAHVAVPKDWIGKKVTVTLAAEGPRRVRLTHHLSELGD